MVRRYSLLLAAFTACLAAIAVFYPRAFADEKAAAKQKEEVKKQSAPSRKAHAELMRKKLESAQNVLEGLVMEDFGMITKGAKQLNKTSAQAEFNVVDFGEYAGYASKFRRATEKLEKAAKEKSLDGATLAYVDLTMGCVQCHKYVRIVPIP